MVLRSGIIIPFQFRDNKKLLMIGVPEENRNLNIWDLRNVVRAAFGIYNFEFRNKKIGFNIPDELLLHYLAQRHDLTNFVIEIGQANLKERAQDNILIESPSSQNFMATGDTMLINKNLHNSDTNIQEFRDPFDSKQSMAVPEEQRDFLNVPESLEKGCVYQDYSVCSETRSKMHSITDEHVIPKSEQGEFESERKNKLIIDVIQDQPNEEPQLLCPRQPFQFRDDTAHLKKVHYQLNPFAPCAMNRFRRRGERMSKDQKEVYVKYFEENPSMLSQRRNDSVLESHWIKLASILNNIPQGAVKNVEEWKQTFDAWRYRVFMYYRYNYKLAGSVTHNVKNFKPLTSTDQRAYSMWTSYKNIPQLDKAETLCKSEDILYDPCKDNFTSIGSCTTCRCSVAQKSSLDMHENASTLIYHQPVGARSNTSNASSQNSQNADELPPAIKMRLQHGNLPASDISHMEVEPKIDYDSAINSASANADVEDSSPPPIAVHSKSSVYADEDQQQHQQELHLERLQHEYALQQHQQQHFEALMQENSTGNSFRQRKERMSKKQKEIYVNFMEQNPVINEHRRSDPILDQYWVKLADILNSVPQGAVKHVAEWKQTFDNWRYRVFLYARYNSKITGADALNPKSFKPLTQTDKRAYHFWIRNPDTAPPDLEKMRNVFVNLEETQQE